MDDFASRLVIDRRGYPMLLREAPKDGRVPEVNFSAPTPQRVELPPATHPDPRGNALTTNEAAKLLGLPVDQATALLAEHDVPRYAAWSRFHVEGIAQTREAARKP